MKHESHEHKHHGDHHGQHSHGKSTGLSGLHRDWRFWVAVGLMLIAMLIYVLSMDESLWPGGDGQEQPAAVNGADAA